MQSPQVILVDENDQPLGVMEKLDAHRRGLLHRAFSVFIMNHKGEMLLQRRAPGKYHSPGLWTNACCSHPMPGESTIGAAVRRLKEEMGFTCGLELIGSILYRVEFTNGLIEHEYDHILLGYYEEDIQINREEVSEFIYLPLAEVDALLEKDEERFTHWFKIAFPQVKDYIGGLHKSVREE